MSAAARVDPIWGAGPAEPAPFNLINPIALLGRPVPERGWIVENWLPMGAATIAFGDGGVGKTLLSQQLMTSCATGTPWCGLGVMRCKSLALYCEDGAGEIHARQEQINAACGVSFANLGAMRWASGLGDDNALATFDGDGAMMPTARFADLREAVLRFGAKLIVLDTAADLFSGNENDRHQVRQFLGLLARLALDVDGAVLLNAHPSRAGLASGNLDGGSTAWSNSARSRWSLARPSPVGSDGEAIETDERVLTRRKANYAAAGEAIRLRWHRGVLVPLVPVGGIAGATYRRDAEAAFLALLDRCTAANMPVSASANAVNHAPKVFAGRSDRVGFTRKDFAEAMASLVVAGRLVLINYGRKGDERRRLVRAPDATQGGTETGTEP